MYKLAPTTSCWHPWVTHFTVSQSVNYRQREKTYPTPFHITTPKTTTPRTTNTTTIDIISPQELKMPAARVFMLYSLISLFRDSIRILIWMFVCFRENLIERRRLTKGAGLIDLHLRSAHPHRLLLLLLLSLRRLPSFHRPQWRYRPPSRSRLPPAIQLPTPRGPSLPCPTRSTC